MTRVGLVGLGYWGLNLARSFDALTELRWLCDISPEALDHFGTRYPQARTTTEYDEMLSDPELEAVVVATLASTHYELAKRALEAGKHVFVEKPPATTAAEAEDLIAAAESNGLVLMPGHLLLYHPGVAALKRLVDTGELGEVLYLYSNRQNLGKIRTDENPDTAQAIASADSATIAKLKPPSAKKKSRASASASSAAGSGFVVVRSGDTLSEIARRHGVSVSALKQANGLGSSSIRAGQRLKLPA